MLSLDPDALKILLVDDSHAHRRVLAADLRAMGHDTLEAQDAEQGVALYRAERPDIVLMDVDMPGHSGHWAARQMRLIDPDAWAPIIFLSGLASDADLAAGIDAGGDDYLFKPVSSVVLKAKLRAMQRLRALGQQLQCVSDQLRANNSHLQQLTLLDALTGLTNRRGLDLRLDEELRAARRDQSALTVILVDVDNFKLYNDSAGHLQGDECLRRIGQLLGSTCRRPRDLAARFGGEEFVILLPGTSHSGAVLFAKALRRTLHQLALPHPAQDGSHCVTISGGITTAVPDGNTTIESLLSRADAALYTAKSLGRDRFFCFETQTDTTSGVAEAADYDRAKGSTADLF
jgi:diguanylate cyclase (GGDEF)-like protein